MPTFHECVRTLRRGPDREAALQEDRETRRGADAAALASAWKPIAPFTRESDGPVLGTTATPTDEATLVRVPQKIAFGLSAWIVGATGSGKTTALTSWVAQDIATPGVVTIALDYKGDFASALTEVVIPRAAMQATPEEGARLLATLRVWAPWSNRKIPSLHLTAQGGSISRRATALADLFVATAGAGELGVRQLSILLPALKLLMATGVPMALLPEVLTNPCFRRALLQAAGDAELTSYFENRFTADAREGATYSILSRFDRFLADDVTKLALFGPTPFDASSWLESGTTICNFGGGLDSQRRFWASFVQHALVSAILSRQVTRSSPRVLLRIDEFQLGLAGNDQAMELENALSLMRSKRASLWVAHQHVGQLVAFPNLVSSLKTNTGMQVVFRVPQETASAMSCVLPEDLPQGIDGRGMNEGQIRQAWERALGALPDRTFLLRVPTLAPSSIPVRAADFDLDAMKRGLPKDIVLLAREGQDGFTREELRLREDEWRRAVAELSAGAEPGSLRLADLVDHGDTVGAPRRAHARRARPEVG